MSELNIVNNAQSSLSAQKVNAYAVESPTDQLHPFEIERRAVGPKDVRIQILYCGVCHSDIHQARDEWGGSIYPMVPGHEIVGKVISVGSEVSQYKTGDTVGVGCMVGACLKCDSCDEGLEQYCQNGFSDTYNCKDEKHQNNHYEHSAINFGGYSQEIVVDEHFVLSIPENLDLKRVAPLLCAGITTWSPLKHWKVGKGQRVGIIGLGGLGHMGIKLAHALGAHVTMITTSPEKGEDAKNLGADAVLISNNPEMMEQYKKQFDFLLNTIPVSHDLNPYINLLSRDGTMVLVGVLETIKSPLEGMPLILGRKQIAGSVIGGIKETQEMLDFCGEHNILPDVEMINMDFINSAYDRMLKSDVKYRFVIDIESLKQ